MRLYGNYLAELQLQNQDQRPVYMPVEEKQQPIQFTEEQYRAIAHYTPKLTTSDKLWWAGFIAIDLLLLYLFWKKT